MIQSTISIVFVTTDNAGAYNLEKVLKSNGYRLMVAETLSRALIEIRRVAPAIILLDRQLLAKEGIRRNQLPPAIPIIVLQPFEESCGPDDCVSELDAGFDQIVSSLRYRELLLGQGDPVELIGVFSPVDRSVASYRHANEVPDHADWRARPDLGPVEVLDLTLLRSAIPMGVPGGDGT